MGTENKVYQQMLKNEKTGSVVFGYTGSYNHGSIDTLPEWKAKDKEVTKYINSLADKKRITSIDKKRAGFYLKIVLCLLAMSASGLVRGTTSRLGTYRGTYPTFAQNMSSKVDEPVRLTWCPYTRV